MSIYTCRSCGGTLTLTRTFEQTNVVPVGRNGALHWNKQTDKNFEVIEARVCCMNETCDRYRKDSDDVTYDASSARIVPVCEVCCVEIAEDKPIIVRRGGVSYAVCSESCKEGL